MSYSHHAFLLQINLLREIDNSLVTRPFCSISVPVDAVGERCTSIVDDPDFQMFFSEMIIDNMRVITI